MLLPIDYRRKPIREKYLSETPLLSVWFIFGESEHTVDIASTEGDVFTHVPRDVAKRIIDARNEFCDTIAEILG